MWIVRLTRNVDTNKIEEKKRKTWFRVPQKECV